LKYSAVEEKSKKKIACVTTVWQFERKFFMFFAVKNAEKPGDRIQKFTQ